MRCILVESPDRFARDLTVQLTGHDFLKSLGISLIPATAPDFFTEDAPTAVLVRQVLGAIAQFEKTSLVAKLKAARDRKKAPPPALLRRWQPKRRPRRFPSFSSAVPIPYGWGWSATSPDPTATLQVSVLWRAS